MPKRQTSKVPNSNIVLAVYYQTCFDVARWPKFHCPKHLPKTISFLWRSYTTSLNLIKCSTFARWRRAFTGERRTWAINAHIIRSMSVFADQKCPYFHAWDKSIRTCSPVVYEHVRTPSTVIQNDSKHCSYVTAFGLINASLKYLSVRKIRL